MSTPTASNSQSTPQLDESIRISHLEPMRGEEKKLGFLSFGHWAEVPGSRVPSAAESLHQAIDLAVGAEDTGLDGAFFRVHHFDQQQATPYPLLSAIAAKTERIELGTGVIDMRYENPLYMAELAAMADLIAAGRLQLGVSRGSPESVIRGFESFGYYPAEGETRATWRAVTSTFSSRQSRVRVWHPALAFPASTPPSSRSRRVCVSASGGVQAPTVPPCGPRRRV